MDREAILNEMRRGSATAHCGRVESVRQGRRTTFVDVYINGDRRQLMFPTEMSGVSRGDIISWEGTDSHSRTGEPTTLVSAINVEARPAQTPQRNSGTPFGATACPEGHRLVMARSRMFRAIRGLLETEGFFEVETPIMHQMPTGASARAFETTSNQDGSVRHLRISPELYHQSLVAAGLRDFFEIARVFRNEGTSSRHAQEFTILELVRVGATLEDIRRLFTRIVSIAADTLGVVVPEMAFEETFPINDCPLAAPSVSDPRISQRFEVYIRGIEIANAYVQIHDATEQRRVFESAGAQVPQQYIDHLDHGSVPNVGLGIGLDRLLMVMMELPSLRGSRPAFNLGL